MSPGRVSPPGSSPGDRPRELRPRQPQIHPQTQPGAHSRLIITGNHWHGTAESGKWLGKGRAQPKGPPRGFPPRPRAVPLFLPFLPHPLPAAGPCKPGRDPAPPAGPGRQFPGGGHPEVPGMARSPPGLCAPARRLRTAAPGSGGGCSQGDPAARRETRRSGCSGAQREPGRGRETPEGVPGRAPGEGVPAHPAGAAAARGRRRLRVAASFAGWRGAQEAQPGDGDGHPRPVPVPVPLPLPGASGTCL